jgi:sulfur carrier protein ThiS
VVEIARAGAHQRRSLAVVRGTLVRDVVRRWGGSPEGCAVLIEDVSVPLDLAIDRPVRLVVVPTFSGG